MNILHAPSVGAKFKNSHESDGVVCLADEKNVQEFGYSSAKMKVRGLRSFIRNTIGGIVIAGGGLMAPFVSGGADNIRAQEPGGALLEAPDTTRKVILTDEMKPISEYPENQRDAERKRRHEIWLNEVRKSKAIWESTLDILHKKARTSWHGEVNAYQELHAKRTPADLGHSEWGKGWRRVPGTTIESVVYQYVIRDSDGKILRQTPWYYLSRCLDIGEHLGGTRNPHGHDISYETNDLEEAVMVADTLHNQSVEHSKNKRLASTTLR